MMITGFYARPQKKAKKMSKTQVESLIKFCATAWMTLNLMPAATPVMASTGQDIVKQVAVSTFGPGGPGFLIISLLLIALVCWLAGYIAQACGKGQISGMIHIVGVFSCISMVAGAAYKALGSLAQFLG